MWIHFETRTWHDKDIQLMSKRLEALSIDSDKYNLRTMQFDHTKKIMLWFFFLVKLFIIAEKIIFLTNDNIFYETEVKYAW